VILADRHGDENIKHLCIFLCENFKMARNKADFSGQAGNAQKSMLPSVITQIYHKLRLESP
jgi:hypothetical protein